MAESPTATLARKLEAAMINGHVIVWLLTGGVIGWLAVLQRHFSVAALLASLLLATAMPVLFGLIRRQLLR
jgi:hypothetical protein